MEIAIVILLFISLALNPAMAISYLTGLGLKAEDQRTRTRIRMIKSVQVINAVIAIALFVLVNILFNGLATGAFIIN